MAAQSAPPLVVDNITAYRRSVVQQDDARMIALQTYVPYARYELAYATNKNFTHRRLYASGSQTYLRQPAAAALKQVAHHLAQNGYGLIVWDAYRPYGVTKKMWKIVGDQRYVAHPAKGSGHNRGTAIDLSLYALASGAALDMGTGFDNFTDQAHHNYTGLTQEQKDNRALLKTAMETFGFTALQTEWWHYSWRGKTFPVLDITFRQLARLRY